MSSYLDAEEPFRRLFAEVNIKDEQLEWWGRLVRNLVVGGATAFGGEAAGDAEVHGAAIFLGAALDFLATTGALGDGLMGGRAVLPGGKAFSNFGANCPRVRNCCLSLTIR